MTPRFRPERWRQVNPLLDHGLALAVDERGPWLDSIRATDPELARDLELLLATHDRLDQRGFLDDSPGASIRPAPLAGQQCGAYTLLCPIGHGGMGSVWVAEHLGLKMPVAVKFLREQYLGYPQAIARLRREAAAAARIRSPHVVQIFDLQVTDEGVPYIVMELLEGESLEEHLERNGPLSLEETAEIVRQVGAAVAKAHDLGIVHRDIKPDNVFLVDTERELFVKVLDFGVALDLSERNDRLTVTGAVVGTPHFMSPEQMIGGEDIGPASDVWSLGVVAYRCLTDAFPYEGDSVAAIAIAVDRGPPIPPSMIVPQIPAPVDEWIDGRPMPDNLDGRMVDVSGGASFLLCRRASRLSSHAAQWALPGGRLDPGETAVDAALRELYEEVGVELPADSVLGLLDDYPTRSGYVITPVVVWGGGRLDLRPSADEVVAVYRVGLHQLQRADSPRFISIPESPRPVVQIPLGGDLIHAPTGAVLLQLRWLGLEGRADAVDELEQPVFAWR